MWSGNQGDQSKRMQRARECVCLCVCEREGGGERERERKREREWKRGSAFSTTSHSTHLHLQPPNAESGVPAPPSLHSFPPTFSSLYLAHPPLCRPIAFFPVLPLSSWLRPLPVPPAKALNLYKQRERGSRSRQAGRQAGSPAHTAEVAEAGDRAHTRTHTRTHTHTLTYTHAHTYTERGRSKRNRGRELRKKIQCFRWLTEVKRGGKAGALWFFSPVFLILHPSLGARRLGENKKWGKDGGSPTNRERERERGEAQRTVCFLYLLKKDKRTRRRRGNCIFSQIAGGSESSCVPERILCVLGGIKPFKPGEAGILAPTR